MGSGRSYLVLLINSPLKEGCRLVGRQRPGRVPDLQQIGPAQRRLVNIRMAFHLESFILRRQLPDKPSVSHSQRTRMRVWLPCSVRNILDRSAEIYH